MADSTNNRNLLTKLYLNKINTLRQQMVFRTFKNNKPYSFDYVYKADFQTIEEEIKATLSEKPSLKLSPLVKNLIPIFLPSNVSRIAFFEYTAKSVRVFNTDTIENSLRRQAHKQYRRGEIKKEEIEPLIKKELLTFYTLDEENKKRGEISYRHDLYTQTIQFNAYDKEDCILIEKSHIRGGLVFDMKIEEFNKIIITHPQHRKKRADKKDNYLPLTLLKIRAFFKESI